MTVVRKSPRRVRQCCASYSIRPIRHNAPQPQPSYHSSLIPSSGLQTKQTSWIPSTCTYHIDITIHLHILSTYKIYEHRPAAPPTLLTHKTARCDSNRGSATTHHHYHNYRRHRRRRRCRRLRAAKKPTNQALSSGNSVTDIRRKGEKRGSERYREWRLK